MEFTSISQLMAMKRIRLITLVLLSTIFFLSGCKTKTGISRNELGYDFSTHILNNTRLDTSNLKQTTGDTDAFWFIEKIFDHDAWTILSLSDDHKELWFYSKTWLFDERELDLFQTTQGSVIQALNKLYGNPVLFSEDNDLVLFDRSVEPHIKIYGAAGIWKVSDQIEVRLYAACGSGNVGIYEPDSVDDNTKYYIQIDYRWIVEDPSV